MNKKLLPWALIAFVVVFLVVIWTFLDVDGERAPTGQSALRSETAQPDPPAELQADSTTKGQPDPSSGPEQAEAQRQAIEPESEPERRPRNSGIHVHGSITNREGEPVGDARVRVELDRQGSDEELGTTRSDAEGSYELFVPRLGELSDLARAFSDLRVEAFAPGHQPARARQNSADWTLPSIRIDLTLKEGAQVYGRILFPNGDPVVGASVLLATGSATERRTTRITQRRTGADGSYSFVRSNDVPLFIHASKRRFGRLSWSFPDEVAPEGDLAVPDLVLVTTGILAGRVVCTDGSPVAGISVHAEPVVAQHPEDGISIGIGFENTDGLGEFRFQGLDPGRYRVYLDGAEEGGEDARLEVATGREDLELTVEGPLLVVSVQDSLGVALPGIPLEAHELVSNAGSWSTGFELSSLGPMREAIRTFRVGEAELVRLAVELPDGSWCQEDVDVRFDGCVMHYAWTVTPPARGRLRVRVQERGGDPIGIFDCTATTLQGEERGWFSQEELDEEGWYTGLAEGRYLLDVEAGDGLDSENPYVPVEGIGPVDISAAHDREVTVEVERGARLRLVLNFPASSYEREPSVFVSVTPDFGRPRALSFFTDDPPQRRMSNRLKREGRYLSSKPLTAGSYRVRIAGRGLAAVERTLQITAGGPVELEAQMLPE